MQNITLLCELVEFLRAWWEEFNCTIRRLDRAASVKAHDAMLHAVILARQLSRELGFVLPDFSNVDWSASVPPADRPQFEDL
jgi:hypothetical protein